MTAREFVKGLKSGPYAWPGGYPIYLVMADGEALCFDCAKAEKKCIIQSNHEKLSDGWRAAAFNINWEDPDLYCAHCNKRIESAYAEPEGEV